jgi:hypothetical protein
VSEQQSFYDTPDGAVDALVAANRKGDKQALLDILGPQAEKLIYSGDPVADRDAQEKFIAAYDAGHRLETAGDDKDVLVVGLRQWPVPLPVVRTERGWRFDTVAGEQSIIDRRIGRNELNVINVCRAYVEAQRDYAAWHKKKYGYAAYAQRLTSTQGHKDGLYWPTAPDEDQSPFGPLMAEAQADGYDYIAGPRTPYHGYIFRVLRRQGPAASGGERDYVVNGHMTRGFALIASPAMYGNSGIKSFIVNQNGIVHERDLGRETPSLVAGIDSYDPSDEWQTVR